MSLKRLLIITGDYSGDVHGAIVIRAMQQAMPEVELHAIGGPNIAATGVHLIEAQHGMGVFGHVAALAAIPRHLQLGRRLLKHAVDWQADAVLLIDYGGFNLRLAARLKKLGIPAYYYIPPQVWASRPGRLKRIKAAVEHVFCIFPFEPALYEAEGIPVTYVGHPLLEELPPAPDRLAFCRRYGLDPDRPIVGIFPGSRRAEVTGLLPDMLAALPLIRARHPDMALQFVLAQSPSIPDALLAPIQAVPEADRPRVIRDENHALLALSRALLAASGTVTLEAALYGTPAVIVYRLSRAMYWIGRFIITIPCFGLPNILMLPNPPILPELLMDAVTPDAMAQAIAPFLIDGDPARARAVAGFDDIRQRLGQHRASEKLVATLARLTGTPLQNGQVSVPSDAVN